MTLLLLRCLLLVLVPLVHARADSSTDCSADCVLAQSRVSALQDKVADLERILRQRDVEITQLSQAHPYTSTDVVRETLATLSYFSRLAFSGVETACHEWMKAFEIDILAGNVAELSYAALEAVVPFAKNVSSDASVAVADFVDFVSCTGSKLYKDRIEEKVGDQIQVILNAYRTRVEPQLKSAAETYMDSVHVHVLSLGMRFRSAAADIKEACTQHGHRWWLSASTARQLVATELMLVRSSWHDTLHDAELLSPWSYEIFGKQIRFPLGLLDVCLAILQATVLLSFLIVMVRVVMVNIIWRICMKKLLWHFGVSIVGKLLFVGVPSRVLKLIFCVSRLAVCVVLAVAKLVVYGCTCAALGFALVAIAELAVQHGLGKSSGPSTYMALSLALLLCLHLASRRFAPRRTSCLRSVKPGGGAVAMKSTAGVKAERRLSGVKAAAFKKCGA